MNNAALSVRTVAPACGAASSCEASIIVDSVDNLTELADRCSLRLIDAISRQELRQRRAAGARRHLDSRAPRSPKLLGIGYNPAMEDGDANSWNWRGAAR